MYRYGISAQKASAVIVDSPVNLTLKQLVRAQMLLADPACKFIVGATDAMVPTKSPFIGEKSQQLDIVTGQYKILS